MVSYLTDKRYAMASVSSSNSDSSPSGIVVAVSVPEKTYFWPQVGSMPECWCWRVLELLIFARFVCGSGVSPPVSSASRLEGMAPIDSMGS